VLCTKQGTECLFVFLYFSFINAKSMYNRYEFKHFEGFQLKHMSTPCPCFTADEDKGNSLKQSVQTFKRARARTHRINRDLNVVWRLLRFETFPLNSDLGEARTTWLALQPWDIKSDLRGADVNHTFFFRSPQNYLTIDTNYTLRKRTVVLYLEFTAIFKTSSSGALICCLLTILLCYMK
jgi:hypothetical protein